MSETALPDHPTTLRSGAPFEPTRLVQIELSRALPRVRAQAEGSDLRFVRAQLLVRWHGAPLGLVTVPLTQDELRPEAYAPLVWSELGERINRALREDGQIEVNGLCGAGLQSAAESPAARAAAEFLETAPFISVVVPTRDRPEDLQRCLAALTALDYPRYEILVVDNASRSAAPAEVVHAWRTRHPQVQYLREDRPGAAWARNCGWRQARGTLVAFTDDDTEVDPQWLLGIARGFAAAPNVGVVSGLTLPPGLHTPTQQLFEQFSSFSFGFERVVHNLAEQPLPHPLGLYPYSSIKYGVSVNIAYSLAALRACGGFSPALGAGTPSLAGEDVELYLRVLLRGYTAVYEPGALLFHHHRVHYDALKKQVFGYGAGTTAFAAKMALNNPRLLWDLLCKFPRLAYSLLHAGSPKNGGRDPNFPSELRWLEVRGMLYGPFGWLRAEWNARRLSRPAPVAALAERAVHQPPE